jgi:competence protein ComEC
MVLPLAMYRFHVVPPAAILLNLVLVIPVSVALFSGFGAIVTGELFPPLAGLCGAVCDGSLAALEGLILFAQNAAELHFWTPGPAAWWVLGTYAGLAGCAAFPRWRPSRRWLIAGATAWMALGLAPPDTGFGPPPTDARPWLVQAGAANILPVAETAPQEQIDCTFIAVGHGISTLIEFPDGRTLLYDAGSLGPPTTGARAIASVLWSRGLRHIDAVVLSHADADHYNALPELLKRFSVGVVYVSPLMFDEETPALTALRAEILETNTPLEEISLGDRLAAGEDVLVEVLHPPARGVIGNDNANSIVLHVEAHGRKLILPGDLEGRALEDLLLEEPIDYDVILAPHHGSSRSNPAGFAEWTTPEMTVISGARSDISEEVKNAYRGVGSRVYHTAEDGAVRITLRRDSVFAQTWRGGSD